MWKDTNYASGGLGYAHASFLNGMRNFADYGFGWGRGPLNDNTTSVYNNGNTQTSYLFYNQNFQAQLIHLPIKVGVANLGIGNDAASSGAFQGCVSNPSSYVCT